jgi:hypothetical protein
LAAADEDGSPELSYQIGRIVLERFVDGNNF